MSYAIHYGSQRDVERHLWDKEARALLDARAIGSSLMIGGASASSASRKLGRFAARTVLGL